MLRVKSNFRVLNSEAPILITVWSQDSRRIQFYEMMGEVYGQLENTAYSEMAIKEQPHRPNSHPSWGQLSHGEASTSRCHLPSSLWERDFGISMLL